MSKKAAQVEFRSRIFLEDFAGAIAGDWELDPKDIMKFILAIDEGVCDYDFTKKLWKKLKKITDAEDKASK